MQNFDVSRKRRLSLILTAVIALAGWHWLGHDTFLVAAFVSAAGLIWSSRQWKAWFVAALLVAGGLFWSYLDQRGCSAWWRGRILYQKLAGDFAYLGWPVVRHAAFGPCALVRRPGPDVGPRIKLLAEKAVDKSKWELYRTDLGDFWFPAPGKDLLTWLVWELTVQSDYEDDGVAIRPGDTVVDGGAHVGLFCAYALRRGAKKVIAVEPDPTNIACLETNLGREIATGRVVVVKAGIWDRRGSLPFAHSQTNSGTHSFVNQLPEASILEGMPVVPLDDVVAELELDRVNFIKMDIEGAERRALQGARETIRRFKPRMAICTYHLIDDPTAIPAAVKSIEPTYRVHGKDIEFLSRKLVTKALYFRVN